MSNLRLLVRSALAVLRAWPGQRATAAHRFIPTRIWWVPAGREISPALAVLIETQERLRLQQPHG